jgi:hypothetical protein
MQSFFLKSKFLHRGSTERYASSITSRSLLIDVCWFTISFTCTHFIIRLKMRMKHSCSLIRLVTKARPESYLFLAFIHSVWQNGSRARRVGQFQTALPEISGFQRETQYRERGRYKTPASNDHIKSLGSVVENHGVRCPYPLAIRASRYVACIKEHESYFIRTSKNKNREKTPFRDNAVHAGLWTIADGCKGCEHVVEAHQLCQRDHRIRAPERHLESTAYCFALGPLARA